MITIDDSIIKKINGYLLTSAINHKYLEKIRPFIAAKSVDMFVYVKPIQRDLDQEANVTHIGTKNTRWNLLRNTAIKKFKTVNNKIAVSAIVQRSGAYNGKVEKVKTLLKHSVNTLLKGNLKKCKEA